MIVRRIRILCIAFVLAFALAFGASAQSVMQMVTVKVKPGQMSKYLKQVQTLQGMMDRVGGGARIAVWQATFAGADSGNTLVSVSHPSLKAFAQTTTKLNADPEWQKAFGALDGMRTVQSNALAASADGGGQPEPVASGSVLQGVLVRVKPGKMADYLKQIEALNAVQKRVGSTARARVWQAMLAGQGTGTLAVGIVHPNLETYADTITKLNADAEWQKLMGSLDGIRTLVSSSLFVAP